MRTVRLSYYVDEFYLIKKKITKRALTSFIDRHDFHYLMFMFTMLFSGVR